MRPAPLAVPEASNLRHPATPPEGDTATALAALAALNSTCFPSVKAATQAYLSFVMRIIGTRSAFVAQFTDHGQEILHSRDAGGCAVQRGRVPIERTFCQYVRASGTPVVITDAACDVRVQHIAANREPAIGSYLGVPLTLSTGELYGTLCVLDPQPRTFAPAHVELLRIAARHLALLIECDQRRASATTDASSQGVDEAPDTPTMVLRMVAHDMRSPLTGIQGYTELLQEGLYGPVSSDQQQVLSQIAEATQFINRLTNDLLDAAAADAGKLSFLIKPFEPYQLARTVLETCRAQAATRGLRLHLRADTALATMYSDSDRLRQILLNFMSNALAYTTQGSVTLRLSTNGHTIRFQVEDTGPGIPAEAQHSIWNKHTRISNDGRGLGLGLYIVQRLAQAMDGAVGVESVPGQGSTFWVELPLHGPVPHLMEWVEGT